MNSKKTDDGMIVACCSVIFTLLFFGAILGWTASNNLQKKNKICIEKK